MSLEAFTSGLATVLLADPDLTVWVEEIGDCALTPIMGNREVERIAEHHLPALVIELGEATTSPEVGGYEQRVETEIFVSIVWREESEEAAFSQRQQLPGILIKAVMAARTLNDVIDECWVEAWEPDRGANHPLNWMPFTIKGEYTEQLGG